MSVDITPEPTQPVSAASLPLPTGASTSALQGAGLPAALGAGGGVKVDGSGTALPVSGTVTVIQGTAANLKVDPSGVTSPVSGTVTANAGTNLNTSALATVAKQPALGTAGTASADVISVQGVASMTPVTVGGKTVTVTSTLTRPADTTAYAAGDSVSSSTSAPTIITFSNVARSSGGSGTIIRVLMSDSAYSATPGSFELWLLDTTTTPTNDNVAFAPSDGDVNTAVAIVPLTAVYAGTATVGTNGNMLYQSVGPFPFVTVGSANLFGIVVVRTAYTPISGEIFQFRLVVAQD